MHTEIKYVTFHIWLLMNALSVALIHLKYQLLPSKFFESGLASYQWVERCYIKLWSLWFKQWEIVELMRPGCRVSNIQAIVTFGPRLLTRKRAFIALTSIIEIDCYNMSIRIKSCWVINGMKFCVRNIISLEINVKPSGWFY